MMIIVYLILAFVVTVILSVLLLRAGVIIMARQAGKHIHEMHQNIEHIINTRKAPQSWTTPFEKQLAQFQQHDPRSHCQSIRAKTSAKKTCLKKLKKLITYTQNSLIIQDEETRQILLKDLTAIYHEWTEWNWEDMISEHG